MRLRLAVFLVILAGFAPAALGGCAVDRVVLGPAGEPTGSHQPTWLRFTIEADPFSAPAAQSYADSLAAVGVRVDVQVLPRDTVVQDALAGRADACLLGWSGPTPDPGGVVVAKLTPGGAQNYSRYDCPEMDRLLAGMVARQAAEEKVACARAAQEALYEEAPWVFGLSYRLYDAAAATLNGAVPGSAGGVDLRQASYQSASPDQDFVVGLGLGERPGIDPFGATDPQAGVVYRCLFDALAGLAPDGSLCPALAESWELSTNGRRLVVKLREGVRFHDGSALHASDVVFTYQRALAGRLPAGLGVSATASGPLTVAFDFSCPFGSFMDLFGLMPVVPAGYYETVGAEGFSLAPVGTGPFRLEPGKQGRQLVLTRWDGYWGKTGETTAGSLTSVTFAYIPDPARRLAMLESGRIALAPALSEAAAEQFRALPGVSVQAEPGWNQMALELNTRREPFNDARVRLALNFATDRRALARALGPEAVVLATAFFTETPTFDRLAGEFGLDPERARGLLRQAGYLVLAP